MAQRMQRNIRLIPEVVPYDIVDLHGTTSKVKFPLSISLLSDLWPFRWYLILAGSRDLNTKKIPSRCMVLKFILWVNHEACIPVVVLVQFVFGFFKPTEPHRCYLLQCLHNTVNSFNPEILTLQQLRWISSTRSKSLQWVYIDHCISWPLVSHSINFFSYEDSWSCSTPGRRKKKPHHHPQKTLMPLNHQLKEIP